jgi:hypothetical protein
MKRTAGLLTTCTLLLATSIANAAIIYSNFDGVTFTDKGREITSSFNPSFRFTATDTGYLSTIQVAGDLSATPDSFNFSLYDNNNVLLESWTTSFINSGGTVATLTSTTHDLLTSGVTYKLVATPGEATSEGDWRCLGDFTPTLRVEGTDSAVPEPATFALLGGAAVLGIAAMRKRRQ